MIRPATFFAAVLVALAAVSCAKKETSENMTADTTATQAAVMTDGNIVAIFVAANDADIKNGEQAKGKAQSKQVKDFADLMIKDHTQAKNEANDLANRLGITPTDDENSRMLVSDTDAMRDSLGQMKGSAYDHNYVDDEVAIHEKVLTTLDNTLIPNAQNAELKALLQKARPVIQSHLDHAKSLQSAMASK
jgi:putative membrane protein